VSFTGPGCERCNFTGRTTFPNAEPPFNQKPCDSCGGLSQFAPPRSGEVRTVQWERRNRIGKDTVFLWHGWQHANSAAFRAEDVRDVVDALLTAVGDSYVGLLRERTTRAEKFARTWKALAKAAHRFWVRRPAFLPEDFRIADHGEIAPTGAFEFRIAGPRAVREFADAFLEQLDVHGAENCLEFGFYTSRGVHISVELRRHDGKTMAMLRDEQIARAENAETERDDANARAAEMHRRAQRLEGIDQRMEALRASHAREVHRVLAEAERRLQEANLRENALSVRVAEAIGTLPPADRTAERLDGIADRITDGGRCAAYVNVKLIAQYLRIAAATIRTIEWERSFDNNHELCAKANEVATAIGVQHLRELNAANATIGELRAELETLRAQTRGVP